MDFLKNIVVNLKATEVSAVMCVYIIAVTMLGLFGTSQYTGTALGILTTIGVILFVTLGQNATTASPPPKKEVLPPASKNNAKNQNQISQKDGNENVKKIGNWKHNSWY